MHADVILAPSSSVSPGWLDRVYGFYIHELTRYEASLYELTADGRWEPDHLPYWLEQKFCHPLIVTVGDEPAGFAFVASQPMPFMSRDVEFRLCEFFILAAYRNRGVGKKAATAVFEQFRGTFELMVLERNMAALGFWRGIVPRPFAETAEDGAARITFSTAGPDLR